MTSEPRTAHATEQRRHVNAAANALLNVRVAAIAAILGASYARDNMHERRWGGDDSMSDRRRRQLACCNPGTPQYFPSGLAYAHSMRCRAVGANGVPRRGQKVNDDEWLPEQDCPRHPGEDYVGCRACEQVAEDRIQGDDMWEATQ